MKINILLVFFVHFEHKEKYIITERIPKLL